MGLIAKILEFTSKKRILAAPFGGDRVTVQLALPPGYDGAALKEDYIVLMPIDGTTRLVGVASADTAEGECEAGEAMLYARNAVGAKRCRVHVKNTGEIEISNGAGSVVLNANGSIEINGASITLTGDVQTASGISLMAHTHTCAALGSPSGPPLPTI